MEKFVIKKTEMRITSKDREIYWDDEVIPWDRYDLLISTEVFRKAVKDNAEMECKKKLMELFGLFVDASLESIAGESVVESLENLSNVIGMKDE